VTGCQRRLRQRGGTRLNARGALYDKIADNLERYLRGDTLRDLVDPVAGY